MASKWACVGLVVLAAAMMILGAVSIFIGFGPMSPNAELGGAVFFVGGCLELGVALIIDELRRMRASFAPKP